MKAEHRKELETNALAERMGRMVQGMKQARQTRSLLWLVLVVVAVGIVLFFWRRGTQRAEENARNWMVFADGLGSNLKQLIGEEPSSNQAKGAEYEFSYVILQNAIRNLASEPTKALAQLNSVEQSYRELATLCKDDPVLLPEALFAQAVIEETRIIKDDDKWKSALAAYKLVADNHKDTAFGKLAAKRVEVLENSDKRKELLDVYRDLRIGFVREERFLPPPVVPPEQAPKAPIIPVPGVDPDK
jgi:hypothetical protein